MENHAVIGAKLEEIHFTAVLRGDQITRKLKKINFNLGLF